ncbi:transferrin-binding protein-like solute binding protein [Sandarakinorhabdus sp.]|uniref:transferrin-binding protein-like solute binding protein n=1 Tax=Sandarakinorhabdus sp. TaxID=1916663 RepID=UPI00333EC20B
MNVNSARQTKSLRIDGALSSFNFNSGSVNTAGLLFGGAQIGVLASNAVGSEQAAWLDPYAANFNYQSFGVWGTGLVAGSTGKYGVASVGAATGGSAIPSAGTVAFRGIAAGIYTDGSASRYAANATFNVNFGARTIEFTTSNQTITDIRTNLTIPLTWLDLNGTMTYAAGANNFSGNVAARGQTSFQNLTGAASGQFYGPNANELGGTFFLRGSVNTLVGGFGAKQ